MLKKYKLIIFDCDGTLVDSNHKLAHACALTLNEMGYKEYDALKCHQLTHATTISACVETFRKIHDDFDAEKFLNLADHFIAEVYRQGVFAFDDIQETLEYVKELSQKGLIDYCVASNGTFKVVANSLVKSNIKQYFTDDSIFTYENVGIGKPAPDLFLYASEMMGYTPQESLIIEDSIVGLTAANAADIDAVVINRDNDFSAFEGIKTVSQITDMRQLQDILSPSK